jgi:menaquinol-cytochrome c reductase iron-sulfur subunit
LRAGIRLHMCGPRPMTRSTHPDEEGSGPSDDGRRRLLSSIVAALGGLVGAVLAVPFVGFLVSPPVRDAPERWRRVGPAEAFPVGAVRKVTVRDPEPLPWAGFVAASAAFVSRPEADRWVAFSSYCTHVGCPINWVAGARLFLCPCHGGAFHDDGRVAAGPPPRPLATHRIRVRAGQVEIETRPIPFTMT